MKDLVAYLTNFYKKYLQNLKYNVERECIFHLILVGIPSVLILSVRGWGFFAQQNLLSMMKVICQQSLNQYYFTSVGKNL